MAKHNGITLRIGAAYDQVEVRSPGLNNGEATVFDRSKMRKDGKANLQGELRRTTVEVWAEQRGFNKAARAGRIAGKQRDKARREHA